MSTEPITRACPCPCPSTSSSQHAALLGRARFIRLPLTSEYMLPALSLT